MSGNSGCNNYNSQIKLDGNAIDFGPVASTRMACSGNGEPLFFKILETINKYRVSSDKKTLTLIVGDIAVMRFVKK